MTLLEQLDIINFAAKILPLTMIGGIAQEPPQQEVPVITNARKRTYKNYGDILNIDGLKVVTSLEPGLHIWGDVGTPIDGNRPLFIQGHIQQTTTRTLFINGGYLGVANYIPLVCYNNALTGNIPMFIGGLGTTAGSVPTSAMMNLFIQRNYTGAIPLYMLCGPQPSQYNSMPLYISGSTPLTKTMPMVIPSPSISQNNNIPLYTSGF